MQAPTVQSLLRRPNGSSAFILPDALIGIFILAILATLLLVTLNLHQRHSQQLRDQRQALSLAEQALANLRSAAAAAVDHSPANVSVHRSGQKIGDLEWVEILATHEGRHASLVALVPTTAPSTQPSSGGTQP